MDGSGENEKRKKKFERKRKRHKLCRKEIDVTEVMDTQLLELRGDGILTKKFYLGGFFSSYKLFKLCSRKLWLFLV